MAFWNRKYKDSVFTDLFGSDRDAKKNFIELYNALSGNDFRDRPGLVDPLAYYLVRCT